MSSSDEDAGDSLFGDFFVNKSYANAALTFGEDGPAQRTLRLRVSTAACTDHDLTGQTTWPGARLLARFLAAQPDAFFRDCACELGAGTGLAGLYYAARGGDVTLSDSHKVVMALLQSNEGVAAASAAEAAGAAAAAARTGQPKTKSRGQPGC